jgi:hypothetical protein
VDDGLWFEANSVAAERIAEDSEYGGIRVRVSGTFKDNATASIQVDIGFGDKIVPEPKVVRLRPILDLPGPSMKGYTMESSIAEKFDAMVKRGIGNTRMKDFYDIWYLSENFAFEGKVLAKAIATTFETRGRMAEADPLAWSGAFVAAKEPIWRAFLRRSRLTTVPADIGDVVSRIRGFLKPVVEAVIANEKFSKRWKPHGPWKE